MSKLKIYSNELALLGSSVLLMAIYCVLLYIVPSGWVWGIGMFIFYIAELFLSYRLVPQTTNQSRWRVYRKEWCAIIFLWMLLILAYGFHFGTCQLTSENTGLLCIVGIIVVSVIFALFGIILHTSQRFEDNPNSADH